MRFKDFINEDLQGLFGKVKTTNPTQIDYFADKKFFTSPAPTGKGKGKGESTIKRMTAGQKTVGSAVMPSVSMPSAKKQHTLGKPSNRSYFKPTKTTQVKSPLNLSQG